MYSEKKERDIYIYKYVCVYLKFSISFFGLVLFLFFHRSFFSVPRCLMPDLMPLSKYFTWCAIEGDNLGVDRRYMVCLVVVFFLLSLAAEHVLITGK